MAIWLGVSTGGRADVERRFDGTSVSIGAAPGSDLLVDGALAGVVLVVREEPGLWWACAGGPGVTLNGTPLRDEPIEAGDVLHVEGTRVAVLGIDRETDVGAEPAGAAIARGAAAGDATAPVRVPSSRVPKLREPLPPARVRAVVGCAVAALALVGVAIAAIGPGCSSRADAATEAADVVVPLVAATAGEFFGRATPGVTVPVAGRLRLQFDAGPATAVHELRFVARGVAREGALALSLNGSLLGSVLPGLLGEDREHRIRLPGLALRKDGNALVFEGAGDWAVSGVRIEQRPAPGGGREELARRATASYELGEQRLRYKDIAPSNRYDAWAAYRRAERFLEAFPERTPLEAAVALRLQELGRELEANCQRALLAGKCHEELGRPELAVREYENGLQWFPGDEQGCRARLQARLDAAASARR